MVSRNTQGVRLIRLSGNEKLVEIEKVCETDEDASDTDIVNDNE